MNIADIEQRFMSQHKTCPFCDENLVNLTTSQSIVNGKPVELTNIFEYYCNAQIQIYKEEGKVISVEVRSHCENQNEILRKLYKKEKHELNTNS